MTRGEGRPTSFVIVRETTLPRLLWLAWRGRRPAVVAIDAMVPRLGVVLGRVVEFLRRRGLVTDMTRDHAAMVRHATTNEILKRTDSFFRTEAWQARHFGFAGADDRFGAYGYVYRDLASAHAQRKLLPVFLAGDALAHGGVVAGATADLIALYESCFGRPAPAALGRVREPWPLINALLAVAAAVAAAIGVARRIRPFQRREGRFFLGSDYADDPRDQEFWRDLADAPGPLAIVFRSDAQARACRERAGPWTAMPVGAGRFAVGPGAAALAEAVRDVWRLWRHGRGLAPELFYPLVILPAKRMRYRALFARYRFDHFWGRDDYNPEHILRSQELRRVGARSIGISHGFHTLSTVLQQTRYVDYDVYFCFGLDTCRRHLAGTWPAHMKLRNIASFGFSRDDYHRLTQPRRPDIAVLPTRGGADSAWWDAIRALARAFPDRRVVFNVKETYRQGAFRDAIEALLADAPPNVVEYRSTEGRRAYDLLFDCTYLLAEGTTMLTEAVHVGMYAFGLGLDPDWVANPMRDLPGLFVADADEAIARIRGIEAGTYHYPREAWAGDIDLTGRLIWDQFREELGLPPKDGVLDHLRFVPTDDGTAASPTARISA